MEEEKKKEEKKRKWDSIVDSTKKYATLAKEELVRSSKIGKIRLDMTKIKKQRAKKFQELGERSYHLLLEGKIDIEGSDSLKTEIDELDAQIKGKEAEIKEIQELSKKESEKGK
jgi:hypothetical protein